MNTLERWKTITTYKEWCFDGKYEVSNWGNIRNKETKQPLATYSNNKGQGYLKTKIFDKEKKRRILYVHRLVATYYVGIPNEEGLEVNHKDGNVRNNSYTNLEWLTHKENIQHYVEGRKAV